MAPVFRYHPSILVRFPATRAGVLWVRGVDNSTSNGSLAAAFAAEQAAVRARLGESSLSELPTLAAWRRTFSAFGVSPTKHRNAAEALLRRLTKSGEIPSINPLVDIGNLASIRHALPVIVVDLARITGAITVTEATGDERFDDLGGTESERPQPGEVIFVDDAGQVVARRWCWRQGAGTGAGPDTREALIAVEAQHEGAEVDIADSVATLAGLIGRYLAGSAVQEAFLGPGTLAYAPA